MAKLTYVSGVMGAGKTAELLKLRRAYLSRGERPLVLVAAARGSLAVSSRSGDRCEADAVVLSDLFDQVREHVGRCDACPGPVLVDEAHLLEPAQVDGLAEAADLGVPVACFGLRVDAFGRLFPAAARLVELADAEQVLRLPCCVSGCRDLATTHVRLVADGKRATSGPQVDVAAEHRSVCRRHAEEWPR